MLADIRSDLRAVLDKLRQVVYGLRPVELDDLGLTGALRHQVETLSREARRGPDIDLNAPEQLPALSPAVTLAAYRIATEALTNAVRHSNAHHITVTLAVGSELRVTVRDDGSPPRSWRAGVGLHSIADRAEELDGSATVGPVEGGWEVDARLPLPNGSTV